MRKNAQGELSGSRSPLNLPSGDRPNPPNRKQLLQLPQDDRRRTAAEGIRSWHDDLTPAERTLGVLSSMKNLIRTDTRAATLRPGRFVSTNFGSDYRICGLAAYYDSNGYRRLVAGHANNWWSWDGTSWNSILTDLTNIDVKFTATMFNDYLIITNGMIPVQKWNRTMAQTMDLQGRPPKAKYVLSAYKALFLAGVPEQPHMVYASDANQFEVWPSSVDAHGYPIPGDSFAAPVNEKDGDEVTWMQLYRSNILIWKRRSLFELHGPEVGQPSRYWRFVGAGNRGTPNGRTVVEIDGVLYWLSDEGVIAYQGGKPEIISQPIRKTFLRINWAAISMASGGTDGKGLYFLSVPLDNQSSQNTTLVYNTRDGTWWEWTAWSPEVWAMYRKDGTTETPFMGDGNGSVYWIGGTTDNGDTISWEATFGPSTFGADFRQKILHRAFIVASMEANSTMHMATSRVDAGNYVVPQQTLLNPTTAITRIRKWLPLYQDAAGNSAYAPRIKLYGAGPFTLYNIGVEYSEAES